MVRIKRILVIDDDDALLFAFKRIFRDAGFEIHSTDTVEEAKRLIDQNDYDLVISDLRFTEKEPEGGFDIIQYAKRKNPRTKTVLWTAYGREDLGELKATPDFFLKKPIPSEKIQQIMRQI